MFLWYAPRLNAARVRSPCIGIWGREFWIPMSFSHSHRQDDNVGWECLRTSRDCLREVRVWECPWTWDRKLDLFKKQSSSLKQAQLLTTSRAATSWVVPDPSLKIKPRAILTVLFKDADFSFFQQILHLYLEKLAFSMCHSSFQGYVYKRTLSIYIQTHSYTHPQFPSRDSKILASWG